MIVNFLDSQTSILRRECRVSAEILSRGYFVEASQRFCDIASWQLTAWSRMQEKARDLARAADARDIFSSSMLTIKPCDDRKGCRSLTTEPHNLKYRIVTSLMQSRQALTCLLALTQEMATTSSGKGPYIPCCFLICLVHFLDARCLGGVCFGGLRGWEWMVALA